MFSLLLGMTVKLTKYFKLKDFINIVSAKLSNSK